MVYIACLVIALGIASLFVFAVVKAGSVYDKLHGIDEGKSPLSDLIDEPIGVIPGTYGTRRDYGFGEGLTHIDFSSIDPNDKGRIEAALVHIGRMMDCGRACYVIGEDGFTMLLVTRSGSRGLRITYIGSGEAVTKFACDVSVVVISPKPENKGNKNEA